MPFIDIPQFRYGHREQGGVGQGEGEVGQPLGPGCGAARRRAQGRPGRGRPHPRGRPLAGGAGRDPRRGAGAAAHRAARQEEHRHRTRIRYTGMHATGPESLRHFKRTFKQALQRQIASGTYDPGGPLVIPIREDKQYRSWKAEPQPETRRRHHLHDGRLRLDDRRAEGDRPHRGVLDRHLARPTTRASRRRYIIHDAVAQEVDGTPSTTRASRAARRSARPTSCADKIIDDRLPARPVEHLRLPLLRRRQLGRRHPALHRAS